MRRLILNMILVTVAAMIAAAATAQTPSAEVSLPRNPVAGDRFSLTVTVNNPDGNVVPPSAPELEGCTFLGGPGVSTMSSTSIVNGRMQSTTSTGYSFTYRADREGTVKVPAIEVKVSGKTLTTRPGQFTVLKASERRNQGNQGGGIFPGQGSAPSPRQGQGADFRTGANDLFIRVELSAGSVYENQAVECVTKLYSINGQIRSLAAAATPTFDGCLIESLPTSGSIEWNRENFNGQNYYTAVISRSLLYPQRSGEINIGGGEYTINVYREMIVHDFPFSRRVMDDKDVTVKPRPATLKVNPLPQPAPDGFTGAVGQFTAEARLVGSQFKTNEAATLIYTVTGTGNIKYLREPQVDMPSEFELYDPHVENTAHVSGRNMTGTMTVEYTFVPQTVGRFRIGAPAFVYFDPAKRDYVTIPLETFEIDVAQGANVSASASYSGKRDIEAKNTDIHYIKPGASAPATPRRFMASTTAYALAYPLLIVAVAVMLMVMGRNRRLRADVASRRLSRAGKEARKGLARADRELRSDQREQFYMVLQQTLQEYLGAKLSLPGSQLSREKIAEALHGRGAEPQLVAQLDEVLDECEMARYAPVESSELAESALTRARKVISEIENLKH